MSRSLSGPAHDLNVEPKFYDAQCEVVAGVHFSFDPVREGEDIKLQPGINCIRRVWDVCANRVIPRSWVPDVDVIPISHARVSPDDMQYINSPVNHSLWPIPVPRRVDIENVRKELIRHEVRYSWCDVLCLRQHVVQPTAVISMNSAADIASKEHTRLEEWTTDVPLIGGIYLNAPKVVTYLSGLGRRFQPEGWDNERHWLRRAWTLQETVPSSQMILAGVTNAYRDPWQCNVRSRFQYIHYSLTNLLCLQQ
ncbi:hypothetical protein BDZ91DRAFT_667839 [Kalaharituber pfeilii]|nr:hypothetical protein BDZ91DRAFT_667839 [Kalaharituber pfeilii]